MATLRIDADHPGERGKYDVVEVVADDVAGLRALTVAPGVRALEVVVRLTGSTETHLFDSRVAVHDLVVELGRAAVWPATLPPPGLGTTGIDVRVHNPVGLVLDDSPVPDAADLDPGQVARLSMQGVPLAYDPAAGLTLEEHSIVVRRAALDTYGAIPKPSVSVVMATRRPDMVEHALAQVARQRGVPDLELVLAPHGFDAAPAGVEVVPVKVVPVPADTVFGDVLNAAVAAAEGKLVLKMDDDDWYAPDFVADLLRARAYSGADLVGAPDDLYYLEDRDLTLRLGHPGEVYKGFVAGGTMLVDRAHLLELGGFASVPRHVDKALTSAVRDAGGTVYRTHGLGYVLRRTARGHTWDADLDDLVARAARTWPGFRPGRLMGL
ncbi:glycosyltransferase family 2 protein [Nocardioides dilutus]